MAGFVPASGAVSADDIGRIYTKNAAPGEVSLNNSRQRNTVRKFGNSEIKYSHFRGKGWGMQGQGDLSPGTMHKASQPDPSYYTAASQLFNGTDGSVQPYHMDRRIAQSASGVFYTNSTNGANGTRLTGGAPLIAECNFYPHGYNGQYFTGFDSGGSLRLDHRSSYSYYTSTGFNFYFYTGTSFTFTVRYRLYWFAREGFYSSYAPALNIYALGNPTGYLDGTPSNPTRTTLASKTETSLTPGTYENGTLSVTTNSSYPYTTIVFSFVTPPSDYFGYPYYNWYHRRSGVLIGNLSCDIN